MWTASEEKGDGKMDIKGGLEKFSAATAGDWQQGTAGAGFTDMAKGRVQMGGAESLLLGVAILFCLFMALKGR